MTAAAPRERPPHPAARPLLAFRRALTTLLEWVLMAAVAVLTLDVLWGVFSRYFLGEQSRWTEELARMLLIWVSLLGTSVAFGAKAHLGVDFFVGLMDPGARRLTRVMVDLIVILFAVSVMVWGGGRLVAETLRLGQMMMAIHIPKGYVYLAVPISGAFITLFAVESILETLLGAGRDADEAEGEPEPQEGR